MSICKLKTFPVSGRWATAHSFLTSRLEDSIRPPLSTRFAKADALLATSPRDILGGRKKAFRFSTLGRLAAIGRRSGVANVFGMNFSGFIAWWLWRTIYLLKLPRLEKKVRVALDWTLDLWFAKDFACVTAETSSEHDAIERL